MDRRSWPWKKKSSDKAAAEKAAAAADSFATEAERVSSVMISFSASLSIDQEYLCLSTFCIFATLTLKVGTSHGFFLHSNFCLSLMELFRSVVY